MEIGIILLLFANIGLISTADWSNPPFSKPPDFTCTSSVNNKEDCKNWSWQEEINSLYIKFDEEQKKPILISYIHCKDCGDGPKIGPFTTGSGSILDPEIRKEEEGKYALIINNKLDFEIKEQQKFKFTLVLDGTAAKTVDIQILDIDDSPPRITVNEIPCVIPENQPGKTSCTYSIFDPDTVSDMTKITFKVPDTLEIFKFELTSDSKLHNAEASLFIDDEKGLDFETMPIYYFEIEAIDAAGNRGKAQIMIKVQDVNDQPPVWIDIFAMQTFEENTIQTFHVSAKDGDLEVNDIINFELDCGIFNKSINIEPITIKKKDKYEANIKVSKIDRDVPEVENRDNTIKCTLIATDPIFNATADISFIIQDQNDNKPIITLNPKQQFPVVLREEEFTTLDKIFSIIDIDQGNNAQFDVTLENKAGNVIKVKRELDYTEPFQVIPNNGYRNWNFSVSVVKPEILDFDRTTNWREFSLKVHSKDKGDEPQEYDQIIDIRLKNLNDEIPIFQAIEYEISIEENATKNAYILNVFAEDVDVEDRVEYTLSDGGKDYKLELHDNKSVTIYTIRNDVFDYERIKVVYVQISATDTLTIKGEKDNFHTVTQQLKINVLDVNDENPRITLPYETPNITEHSDVGEVVTSSITAEDVDTTAYLQFSIEWNNSRASKLGVTVPKENFTNVFTIDTIFPDEKNTGQASGVLKVKNNYTLDYEVFDTIFLYIKVTDLNQTIGTGIDEGIMTILLIDINDNAPEFNIDTISSDKAVTEHSKTDVKIATIIATDKDGPGFNEITYSIEPRNGTKSGLIKINDKNGELTVDENEKIDADRDANDENYTDYLYYNVIASDIDHKTTAKIEIKVEDINDNKPFLPKPLTNDLEIKETTSTTEQFIQNIKGFDYDRDYPHNNITYYLNNEITQLSNKYKIDNITGGVWAVGIIEWSMNHKEETIYAYLQDNFQQRDPNIEKVNFTVKIIDIDNNSPILPKDIVIINPPIKENIALDSEITTIIATDNDEPCTERTLIEYSIVKIEDEKGREDNELFKIENKKNNPPNCEQIGVLKVNKTLDGYFGKIKITILAQSPFTEKHSATKDYDIEVNRFNFKPPKIVFPAITESSLILQLDQEAHKQLKRVDGLPLKDFEATDDQNGKYEMFFVADKPWDPIFELNAKPGGEKNKARLTLTVDEPPKKEYELQIKAYHDGEGTANAFVYQTIIVKFIDKDQQPTFNDKDLEYQVKFIENALKPRCKTFPAAEDPKCLIDENNCGFKTYYHIMNGEEKVNFEIEVDDNKTPNVCLRRSLDTEEQPYRYLTIMATNLETAPPYIPENYKPLNLTIKVEDVNDNPPEFVSKTFKGGLADTDKIDSVIVTLNATDPDETDLGKLWYHIKENSMTVSDPSLESVKNNMFKIENENIKNLLQPTQAMKGYFYFQVQVFDTLNFSDTADVKIHIISDANRVLFRFKDDIDLVKDKSNDIESVLTNVLEYNCTVDDFAKKLNDTTKTRKTRANEYFTEVKTHFIDNNDDTVDKEEITKKLDERPEIAGILKLRFTDIGLNLDYVEDTTKAEDEIEDMKNLLKILLIVVSVVLGTLCLILIVAFIVRTRSLQKRIEAMTTNVFGSTKSDLNRIGTSAPGTNRHAIEANPVWNEDLDSVNQYDTMSQASGGSDLIGVEDRADFEYGFHRASINPIMQQRLSEENDMNNQTGFSNIKSKSRAGDDDDDDINSLPGSITNSKMF